MAQMQELLAKSFREFKEGSIVKGHILEIRPREVLVDIGPAATLLVVAGLYKPEMKVEIEVTAKRRT